jgi:hypothetical protein
MHEQLGDLSPMYPVLALRGVELHCAHDAAFQLRHEQDYSIAWKPRPPVASFVRGKRRVEAERSAAVDAGNEQFHKNI